MSSSLGLQVGALTFHWQDDYPPLGVIVVQAQARECLICCFPFQPVDKPAAPFRLVDDFQRLDAPDQFAGFDDLGDATQCGDDLGGLRRCQIASAEA